MGLSDDLHGKEVIGFLMIDRLNEGLGIKRPLNGETFWYCHNYLGDHAENWIQIMKDGQISEIVNTVDLAIIEFKKE